jgi:hypothetical protein
MMGGELSGFLAGPAGPFAGQAGPAVGGGTPAAGGAVVLGGSLSLLASGAPEFVLKLSPGWFHARVESGRDLARATLMGPE